MSEKGIRRLLSLPPAAVPAFRQIAPFAPEHMFVASDPPGRQLSSGGGTASLLHGAWQAARGRRRRLSFQDWLAASRTVLIHGSGESRRLPSYAAAGKPLIPIPLLSDPCGQRPAQLLMDLQFQSYEQLLWHAPSSFCLMLGCGDVFLKHECWLPAYPDVDVLIFGLPATVEEACQHGVLLSPADGAHDLISFLQKPSAARVAQEMQRHTLFLDTGLWLLSRKAVTVLMRKCGWNAQRERFPGALPRRYDLYGRFGPALGAEPSLRDPAVNALTGAVLPIRGGRFYHFGTNRSLIASVSELVHQKSDQRSVGDSSLESVMPPVVQNAAVACSLDSGNRHIWIENSTLPRGWRLSQKHVLTGIPENEWEVDLAPGVCLDFAPCDGDRFAIRFYGFDDLFRGAFDGPGTLWLGQPAADWLRAREIPIRAARIRPGTDIQDAPLFPLLPLAAIDSRFLSWLLAPAPSADSRCRALWLKSPRLSARDLHRGANVARGARQRFDHLRRAYSGPDAQAGLEPLRHLDLAAAARLYSTSRWDVPRARPNGENVGLQAAHDRMFRSVAAPPRSRRARRLETEAFDALHRCLVREMERTPVRPRRNVLEDQIIWGRSPVRLDLAGGWTDTPPYCLEHGGQVVNVAVNLNGQPPIQVFARLSAEPGIVVRSIDLGLHTRIDGYEELLRQEKLGSGFGIARAALALAGLHPRFHAGGGYPSLGEQLRRELGAGIELSMLAAVPKGSGLGTSSILAATLLGTLGELLGLSWTQDEILARTLVLEQMLTSGGGWQDQAGGIAARLKLITTAPGLQQRPVFRWLPDRFFSEEYANSRILLYYTGITRVAHDILGEIVRAQFLNSTRQVTLIRDIGQNALFTADAIQRGDWDGLCEAIRRTWRLNRMLDEGTNPPAVQAILAGVRDWVSACKLLGAGGGGYLMLLAKDETCARRIKTHLTASPPNPRSRFVELNLSTTGFQITRS